MRTLPVMLGVPGGSSPAITDFEAMNALIAPRPIDTMLIFQDLITEPVFYSAYTTWASTLGCTLMSTLSPSSGTLGAFTAGTYDSSGLFSGTGLNGLAAGCASYGKPMLIRLAHEFNGNWSPYGNTAETALSYVNGWKHIVTLFRAQGATNVSWVWCANIWGGIESASIVDPTVADGSGVNWYPGDAYVDYISLDGYMLTGDSAARTPSTLFSANYATLTGMTSKLFGISEVGCAADSRLTALCGGKAGWYNLFFQLAATWPKFCFVNSWQRITGPDDCTISSSGTDPAAQAAFSAGVNAYPFAAQPATTQPNLLRLGGC